MNTEKTSGLTGVERRVLMFDAYLLRGEKLVSSLLLVGVVLTVLVGIVLRFVLRVPNMYGEEISRYLLIGCIFIGISIGVREKSHLGIENLVNALPAKASRIVHFIADVLSAFTHVLLLILAYRFTAIIKSFGQTSPAMSFLPMYAVYFLLLMGFALSSLRSFMMIWNDYFSVHKVLSSGKND
jgi:TRAP-type C4-dicarboxylate transport system permease small subunit